ncbi:glycosyltransferase family 2 protein [Microbacterium galbinum]|uniref:Glycosyltransferase n=1 Tax=Microbacterium galbinum TaxID=2851646 RepID=A0ABY4ITT1_9MICO|nr:glycosyltransferase family 2 protein [Microbacterium galbinum]UPL15206.1 glycosyltransferase [Microbacterium galbinum]
MTDEITLSVIVPTHNVRTWVVETLRSILAQRVRSMEVIVVDDHSEDGTVDVVDRLALEDPRLVLVRATERGGGSARNEGVRLARGKYIIFADGDDIVPEGAYSALISSLEDSRSDMAVGDYLKFSPNSTWRPTASMKAFDAPARGAVLSDIPTMIFSRPCWNKAFDREFWERHRIRFPDVPRSNDIVPMVTAYVKAQSIDVVEDVVYLYRDRPGSTSMTSKASSSASFLSYVGQEKICAQLIASVENEELRSRYSSLIHDRDGFFHVRKFLMSWEHAQPSDDAAISSFQELLAMVEPAAGWIDKRKRLALNLFAAGHILAARAVAQLVDGGSWRTDEGLLRLRSVGALLKAADDAAPGLVREHELLWAVAESLTNVRITDDELEQEWLRLALDGVERFGAAIRELVPELAAQDIARVARRQRDLGGTITPLFGSDPLRVHARATAPGAVPVLWSRDVIVMPRRHRWRSAENGATCEAEFAVSQLPHGVLVQPAFLLDDDLVVSGYADSEVPEYRPWENVLYEQRGAWVRLERRAHWVVRAPRRLAIRAISFMRRAAGNSS